MTSTLFFTKKAIIIGVPVGVFLLFVTFLVMSSNTANVHVDNPIGELQYDVLYKSQLASYADLYIDMGATFAAEQAQKEFFEEGGIFLRKTSSGKKQNPPCGSLLYNVYATPTKNCVPDFQESFQMYLSQSVREFVNQFRPVSLQFTYDYEFVEEEKQTTIVATIDQEPKIPLKQRDVEIDNPFTFVRDTLLRYQLINPESIGDETVISCSTGNCVSQVAQSLYKRHIADKHVDYVRGGESPYTYTQITNDQEEKGDESFFADIIAQQYISGTKIPLKPGFDSAGWLWWVAKHANVTLLTQRSSPSQYYVSATDDSIELVCGLTFIDFTSTNSDDLVFIDSPQDVPMCTLAHILDKAQPGDILFIKEQGTDIDITNPISEVALYLGDGQILQSTPDEGLVQRMIPSHYALDTYTSILAVMRYPYDEDGVETLDEEEEVSSQIGGFVYFTPTLSTATPLLFSHFDSFSTFVETLQEECLQPTKECVKTVTHDFNHRYKTRITLDAEENALVYDFVDQLINCYSSSTISCVCTIDIDYSLSTQNNKIALVLFEGGQTYVADVVGSKPLLASMQYITNLDFTPTKLYLSDDAQKQVYFIFDKENKKTTLYAGDQKWVFDEEYETTQTNPLFAATNTILSASIDVQNTKPALYKVFNEETSNDISYASGPITSCTGEEELPKKYIERLYELAWNSDDQTYLQIALSAAKEFNADPALLLAHAMYESSLGANNFCTVSTQQSSLTGCGWQSSKCEDGPTSGLEEYVQSDFDQLRCTAQVDLGAVKEVLTNTPQTLSGGNYVKCSDYAHDSQAYWNCIFCTYQGSYEHAHVAENDDPTGKPYFIQDGTCQYAQTMVDFYCGAANYLEQIGEFSTQTNSQCGEVVEYAKEYIGTNYASNSWIEEHNLGNGLWWTCSAQDAQQDTCRTQCGTFVWNIFKDVTEVEIWGDGIAKCSQSQTQNNQFIEPELLQPGDLFSSTGSTSAGHTGMYVGKGRVLQPSPEKSFCYLEFEPDPQGEHVFIHSIGPVCYNTLEEIENNWNIQTFCRVDICGDITSPVPVVNQEQAKESYPLHWIPFNNSYSEFMCPLSQTAYRFQAELPYVDETLNFAVELAPQAEYTLTTPTIQQQACGADSTPLLLSWTITSGQEPFAFILDLFDSEKDYQTYKKSLVDDSLADDPSVVIPSSLVHRYVPLQGAQKRTNVNDPIDQKNTLYKEPQEDGTIIYKYLWAPQDAMFEELNYSKTYSLVSSELDSYGQEHAPVSGQSLMFKKFSEDGVFGLGEYFSIPTDFCADAKSNYIGSYLRDVERNYAHLVISSSETLTEIAQEDQTSSSSVLTKSLSDLKKDLSNVASAFSQEGGLLAVSLRTTKDKLVPFTMPFVSINDEKIVDTMSAFKIKAATLAYLVTPQDEWAELDTHVQPMLATSDNDQTTVVLTHIKEMLTEESVSLPSFSALDSFLETNSVADSTYTSWRGVTSSIQNQKAYKNHFSSLTSTASDYSLFYSLLYNQDLVLPATIETKVKRSLGLSQEAYDSHILLAQQKTIEMLTAYNDLEVEFYTGMPSSGFTQNTAIGKTGLLGASDTYPHNIATHAGLATACNGQTYSYAVFAVEGETIWSTMQARHDATVLIDSFLQNDLCGGQYETVLPGTFAIEFPEFERITCEETYFTDGSGRKYRICAGTPELVQAMTELDAALKEANYSALIFQAYRSYDIQKDLYDTNRNPDTGAIDPPTCNPGDPDNPNKGCTHLQGAAIDIGISKGDVYNENTRLGSAREDFMCPLGWLRYKGEDWHFEYGSTNWDAAQEYVDEENNIRPCSYLWGNFYDGDGQVLSK